MPLALLSPEVSLALSRSRLLSLCEAFGFPKGVSRKSTRIELAKGLFRGNVTAAAKGELSRFARWASPAGRRALREAGRVTGLAFSSELASSSPSEFAAALLFDHAPADETVRKTLARADLRMDRQLPSHRSYELVAREPGRPLDANSLTRAIRAVHGEALLDVWTVQSKGGGLYAAVIFRGWGEAALDSALSCEVVRPWHVDLLSLRRSGEALFVSVTEPEMTGLYAEALGALRSTDAARYGVTPTFTLKPLQELGDRGLRAIALPDGIRSWSVVGCLWESIEDDARHEVRAPNALRALESKVALDGGYFWRATLRAEVTGAPHAVDIFIELPHRIHVSHPAYEPFCRKLLGALGLVVPGAIPDDSFTLAPFLHAEWRYRKLVGDATFERMLREKRFIEVKTSRVASEAYRKFGRTFRTQPVPNEPGVYYAMCEDPMAPAMDVTAADLAMLKLDVGRVLAGMQETLGLTKPAPEERVKGVGDLGVRAVKGGRIRFFFAMTKPDPELLTRIRKACKVGTTPVLLVPERRHVSDGAMLEIGLTLHEQIGATTVEGVLRRVAVALEIEGEIAPSRRGEPDVLIVTQKEQVFLRGCLMTRLTVNAYRLILALARRPGETIATKELGRSISPSSGNPDQVTRKTRILLIARVRASFEASGVPVPEELLAALVQVDGRRGYRLGVSAKVVESV